MLKYAYLLFTPKFSQMIQHMETGNKGVFAFRVEGKITETDVKQSLHAIQTGIETMDHFNLYIEVNEMDGIELAALKERFSFIFSNYKSLIKNVKRVSLVSDKNWLQKLAQGIYALIPNIEQRSFSFEEKDQARRFVGLTE